MDSGRPTLNIPNDVFGNFPLGVDREFYVNVYSDYSDYNYGESSLFSSQRLTYQCYLLEKGFIFEGL